MKKITFLFALLCASVMGFAIDWTDDTTNPFVPGSSVYQIANFTGSSVVNVQTNWGHEGIYVTFPIGLTSCSLGEEGCHIEGAGLLMYLSALTAEETEVTVVDGNSTNYVFTVHNNTASSSATPIDWTDDTTNPFVPGSSVYQIANFTGSSVVNVQTNWGHEGIYVTFPIGLTSCSLGEEGCHIEGAGLLMYLTALTAEETEVTVVDGNSANYVFTVHNNTASSSSDPTPVKASECFGSKGHFGNPTVKNVYYQIDYEDNKAIISLISLTGYPLDFAEVQISGVGGYAMTANGAGGYTYTFNNPTANAEWYIRFLYSDTNMPGNEMTAETQNSSDANIIYYQVGACTATTTENTNIALSSAGASATASDGNPALAIDGNTGSRWETAASDPQWICVDFGERKKFNTVQLVHEGAYIKTYDIQISDDGTNFTTIKHVSETLAGFPYEQTIELNFDYAAQYMRIYGTERGTGWGYSLWELRAMYSGASVLTSITLAAADTKTLVGGAGVVLTATPKDQKGAAMEETVSYEITPAAAGHMSGNTFIPDQAGVASIRAYNGSVYSAAVQILGVPSANLALSTNISTDNKIVAQSEFAPNGTDAFFAVDGNMGSVWQGSPTNGNVDDSREYDCWFVVDLGAYYNIALVALHFEGACSELYHIDFSANNSDWNLGYNLVGAEGINARNDYWTDLDNNTKVRYVRFWSTKSATGWGMKMYEFEVYGEAWSSSDAEKPVMGTASLVSNTYDQAVIAVTATDNDEVARYHVVDASHGIDVNLTPAAGNITVTGLTHATDYNFTITAKDASGNESDNSVVLPVSIPFNSSINLALNKPCEAGYENTNPGESRDKANDGNDETNWNTYADRPASEEWWYVDLGQVYTLTNIQALWGDVFSTNYVLQARVEAPSAADKANDAAWVTLATITDAAANAEKSTNVSGVGRYVRIHSLNKSANFFRLRELRVFGSGVAPVDAEAPVMTSASLVSSADTYAVIAVAATDDQGIANYHVVDAGNSFNANCIAEGGNITVSGLAGGTAYTLVITAIDFFGNESANSKSVSVTTTAHYTEPQTAAPVPTWPADQVKSLYSNTYALAPASLNGYNEPWWGAPVMAEGNVDGNTYLHYNLAADGIIGWQFAEISVTSMEKLHIDIFSSGSGTLTIRPITTGGPTVRKTLTLVGQQWNSFDIELTEFPGHDWSKLFQFAIEYWNAGGLTGEHISVDNVYLYRESALVDGDAPTNVSASVESASYYSVVLTVSAEDASGVNFKVMNGAAEVGTGAGASGADVAITITGLAPGTTYNFDVIAYDDANNEAAAHPISVTTRSLPGAAPTPTHPAVAVKSIFSDAYTCAVAVDINYCEWWWQAPTVSTVSLNGNDALLYDNVQAGASYGISWNANNKLDASGYQKVHFHIYPTNTATIEIYPVIQPEGEFHSTSQTLVGGRWNEVVIDYTDKTFAPFNQIGFVNFASLGAYFIDNLYFIKDADLVRDDSWMAPGELGTICLPNGAVAEGGDIYQLVGKNSEGKIVFSTVDNNQMAPGVPYLFEAKSNAMKFYYTAEDAVGEPVNTGAMKGTFIERTLTGDDLADVYYFAGRALWSCVDLSESGLHVSANRAWVKMDEVEDITSAAPAPGRRYIIMGVNGENQAQGFENLESGDAPKKVVIEGTLYILRGEKVYDATGRLVK